MHRIESFCTNIESELGHTPLVEAAQMAAYALFNEAPVRTEGLGDFLKGAGRKIGKATAIGALVFNAANANAIAATNSQGADRNVAKHGQSDNVCSTDARDFWNNKDYRELESRYFREEMDRQRKLVEAGKRNSVDEQLAYTKAQMQAMNDVGCASR